MTTAEWQIEQEFHYEKLAKRYPRWAAHHKTYLGWLNSGRQVKKGATASAHPVTACVGTETDIDGEDVTRMATRTVKTFALEQTEERKGVFRR